MNDTRHTKLLNRNENIVSNTNRGICIYNLVCLYNISKLICGWMGTHLEVMVSNHLKIRIDIYIFFTFETCINVYISIHNLFDLSQHLIP